MAQRFENRKGQRGFTLAEIMVTTAIFAIIMIAALAVYDRSNRVFSSSTEAAALQQSTRIGFDKLVSDMRMAGFDYNRGGIPNGLDQYPQPDEQIEYAGPTAVVFRANFDYNTNASRGNGLATDGTSCAAVPPSPLCGTPNYYPLNATGGPIFPYITTDNNEIIAYVLRSTAPGAANSDSISFYADTDIPRRGYPNVSGHTSNGHAENQITISGVDVSNNNPPYTLFRVTVADVLANRQGTPVAENIRSLNFTYYSDALGTTLLPADAAGNAVTVTRNAGGSTIPAPNTGAIGGDGQYDPNAANGAGAGSFGDRAQRALIQSMRVNLVGMNATPTANYQNPTETNPNFANYREYTLSSLIVPRNLGLQGFPEPSYDPPGPPQITGACVGHCGAPFITWTPPSTGGPVTIGYEIQWDTNPNGAFAAPNRMPINNAGATSAIVNDSGLDPSQTIYYRIVAINDNGDGQPSPNYPIAPKNTTQPKPPAAPPVPTPFATSNQQNKITLTWVAPSENATTTMQCTGFGTTPSGLAIPPQESVHFQVARSTDPNFTPSVPNDLVLDFDTASQPATAPGATVTWVDAAAVTGQPTQSIHPPAACVQYYYRVRALDRCYKAGAMNYSGTATDSISDWFPKPGTAQALPGSATSSSTPSTPTGLQLDPTRIVCPPSGSGTTCTIGLVWNKVATDTAGAAVAVDTYTIYRERRIEGSGASFIPDTTFGSAGYLDQSGFSNQTTTLAYWQDTSVPYKDPLAGLWEYRYSVSAKICGTPSPAFSNTVTYPGCNFAVNVTAQAHSGSGTQGDPWVLSYGDSVTVTRTSGNPINALNFQLVVNGSSYGSPLLYSGGASGPWSIAWTDQPTGVTYELWITLTDNNGCLNTYVRYITQQPQAACTFLDLGATGGPGGPPQPIYTTTGSQPRDVKIDFTWAATQGANFTAKNDQTSQAPMFFQLTSGTGSPFQGTLTFVWADINGLHPELTLKSVDLTQFDSAGGTVNTTNVTTGMPIPLTFTTLTSGITAAQTTLPVVSTTAFGATNATGTLYIDSEAMTYTVTNATTLTVVRGALATTAAIHASAAEVEKVMSTSIDLPNWTIQDGQALGFTLHMTYDSSHKNTKLTLSSSIIRSVCITYKVASDLSLTQRCNLVGRLATGATQNPASCD